MRFCQGLKGRNSNNSLVESNSRGAVGPGSDAAATAAQRNQFKFSENADSTIDDKPGWHFKVAIPWAAATDSASVDIHDLTEGCGGTVLGFDIGAADSDGDPNATGDGFADTTGGARAFWDPDNPQETGNEDNAYKNRLLFGFIRLLGHEGNINYTGKSSGIIAQPNPATNQVNFSNLTGFHSAVITNLIGRTVWAIDIYGDKKSIDISDLPAGIYFF